MPLNPVFFHQWSKLFFGWIFGLLYFLPIQDGCQIMARSSNRVLNYLFTDIHLWIQTCIVNVKSSLEINLQFKDVHFWMYSIQTDLRISLLSSNNTIFIFGVTLPENFITLCHL